MLPERLNLSVGGILGHGLTDFDGLSGNFGALYSQLTLGPRDANLTAGFGYGFYDGGWSKGPAFSLAGQLRTGRKFALLSENYFFFTDDHNNSVWSVGGRFIGRYVAVDAALMMLISPDDGMYPIPWLGLRVPFGN